MLRKRISRPHNHLVKRWVLVSYKPNGTKFPEYVLIRSSDLAALEKLWSESEVEVTDAKIECWIAASNLNAAKEAVGRWSALFGAYTLKCWDR